ncbi:dienelactone hydrolase family protein [Nakamurella sp. YIM 132087]|uniref:Dienelactone hydrolase family protein n=1 Tax=Nakamurella alba TaxID=2665158 RepID=A0A7K1FMP3_9ACTN|nr:dienelactone hydrolase family protein [Nakamurella alba]MTD15388.1 dienelactone hydrolase family protein [Nakamurella alba]
MLGDLTAATVSLTGDGGTEIEAYLARPTDAGPRGGVVVIHHMPGYDAATKEITRRFAALGYDAVMPNLYSREAPPGADPSDAAAVARSRGGVPDDRAVGDIGGAVGFLRGLDSSNGRVGVIGYCSGGRQSVLMSARLDIEAAVDCYGAFVVGDSPEGFPVPMSNLVGLLPEVRAPLLGLFGNEDQHPSPAQVDELDRRLTELDKPHEFHRYDEAGHAFFALDRIAYRVRAAVDGWEKVEDFFARHLQHRPS